MRASVDVHVGGPQLGGELLALFRRVVDDQHAVDTGRRGVGHEGLQAVAFHRVGIAHQHQRRGVVAGAELTHIGQHVAQADAVLQRPLAGALDDGTVGHGVGERHAQLDDIGAGLGHGQQQVDGGARMGIAGGDEGDQRLAALGLEMVESGGDAAHCFTFSPACDGRSK
jgi:hypothetical protein